MGNSLIVQKFFLLPLYVFDHVEKLIWYDKSAVTQMQCLAPKTTEASAIRRVTDNENSLLHTTYCIKLMHYLIFPPLIVAHSLKKMGL